MFQENVPLAASPAVLETDEVVPHLSQKRYPPWPGATVAEEATGLVGHVDTQLCPAVSI